ncbi:hypothetical protein D3C71_18560 [compost metagenome]
MSAPSPSLQELATAMRAQFEHVLEKSMGHRRTDRTCALGSILVANAVRQFTTMPATIRGGAGRTEGLRDREGCWQGHYWVEVQAPEGPTIVDITADQFGWPPVLIAPAAGMEGVYRAGDQALVDVHIEAALAWIAADEDDADRLQPVGA